MHNHATYHLAKGAVSAGGVALRIQFRGVGLSDGAHTGGPGELADARAALLWLSGRYPALPLHLGGMSFGAWIALQLGCAEPDVQGIVGAGLASRTLQLGFLPACARRVAAIQAASDELGPVSEVEALMAGPPSLRRLSIVPGTTHLFLESLPAYRRAVDASWEWLTSPRSGSR